MQTRGSWVKGCGRKRCSRVVALFFFFFFLGRRWALEITNERLLCRGLLCYCVTYSFLCRWGRFECPSGRGWNSIWQAMIACIRAEYLTVLFLYKVNRGELVIQRRDFWKRMILWRFSLLILLVFNPWYSLCISVKLFSLNSRLVKKLTGNFSVQEVKIRLPEAVQEIGGQGHVIVTLFEKYPPTCPIESLSNSDRRTCPLCFQRRSLVKANYLLITPTGK